MEERGLVERVPAPDDRRVKLLQLTQAGLETRERISHAVADQALVLGRLTPELRQSLRPPLEALLQAD